VVVNEWIKRSVARAASGMGYEVIPKWRFDRQPLARHLRKLFQRQKIDCVVDVGGNLGQFRDLLRHEVGFDGWILTYEPVAKYISHLRDRAAGDASWRIYPYALGSEKQEALIHVTHSPGLNSFLAPRTDDLDFWKREAVVAQERVSINRLDDVFPPLQRELGICSPFLKLDTQGFDLEVVKGAAGVLQFFNAIQTEASVIPIYHGMPTHLETLTDLSSRGYQLSGMFPVTHDDELRLVEYDCVLVR
jgi:FkbM family methyltransferase